MAYIVSKTQLFGVATVTNLAVTLPTHVANDYFVIFAGLDATGTANAAGSMVWAPPTGVTANVAGTGITSSLFYAKAASSAETLTISTNDAYAIQLIQVRGADPVTPFDVNGNHATNGATLSNTLTSATVVTTTNNALVLYFVASEGTATQTHSDPGVMSLASHDSTGTTATQSAASSAAWTIKAVAGTVPAATWSSSLSTTFTRATIAFRNATSGIIPAYVQFSPAPATRITSAFHIGTVDPTFTFPALTNIGNVAGKTRTLSAAVLGLDFGINPYASGISKTSGTVAATALNGYEINFATARNMTNQLLVGSLIANVPKTGTFSLGTITQGGSVLAVGTSTTEWNAYQIAASDSVPTPEQRYVFAVQPGFSGTAYATGTASANVQSVDFFQFIENYPNGTAGVTYLSEFHQANTHIVAGGTATNPIGPDELVQIGRSYLLPVIQKTGPTSLLSYVPISVGGGDPVDFEFDFTTLQFPRRANTGLREISFHANNNVVGIEYYGKSGDMIKHTNSTITSPNKYYWRFNASTGNANTVTYDFSGLQVVGAGIVGLSSVVPLTEVSFVQCDEIDISSANTLTSCTFSQSTANTTTEGAIKIASTTQAGLQSIVNKLVNCEFADNISNAAIDIVYTGTAGPITLSMTSGTFSGNSKDIRWDAPASSNLTINLSGTANPSTSFATNSNIVTLASTKTFTVTNIEANTELVLYKKSDNSFLASVEDIGNTTPGEVNLTIANDTENTGKYKATYSYNYAVLGVDTPIFVVAHSLGYQWLRQTATLKNTDSEFKISQIVDRQYQNP